MLAKVIFRFAALPQFAAVLIPTPVRSGQLLLQFDEGNKVNILQKQSRQGLLLFTKEMRPIHQQSHHSFLEKNDFVVIFNNRHYYVQHLDSRVSPYFAPPQKYLSSPFASESCGPVAALMAEVTNKLQGKEVTPQKFQNSVVEEIVKQGEQVTRQRQLLDQLIRVQEGALQQAETHSQAAEERVGNRQLLKLKGIFGLFGLQFLAMHYFIYFGLSWDIMEPIACLLGILDVNVALAYAYFNHRDYSYAGVYSNRNDLRLLQLNNEVQLLKLSLDRLRARKLLLSESLEDVLLGVELSLK